MCQRPDRTVFSLPSVSRPLLGADTGMKRPSFSDGKKSTHQTSLGFGCGQIFEKHTDTETLDSSRTDSQLHESTQPTVKINSGLPYAPQQKYENSVIRATTSVEGSVDVGSKEVTNRPLSLLPVAASHQQNTRGNDEAGVAEVEGVNGAEAKRPSSNESDVSMPDMEEILLRFGFSSYWAQSMIRRMEKTEETSSSEGSVNQGS